MEPMSSVWHLPLDHGEEGLTEQTQEHRHFRISHPASPPGELSCGWSGTLGVLQEVQERLPIPGS